MTKEELKQEAENKLDEWTDPNMGCCEGYCYSEVADFMFRFSEPREKRIEELEAKIDELKSNSGYVAYIERGHKIYELEQENAELKEKLGNIQMQKAGEKSDLVWKLKTANEQKTDKLTKATEIIRGLLSCLYSVEYDRVSDLEQAEQFLKEDGE